jgi:hypothetical protein
LEAVLSEILDGPSEEHEREDTQDGYDERESTVDARVHDRLL